MISFHYFIDLLFLICLTKTIHSSIPFIINPGCDLIECQISGYPAIFYANHFVGNNTIHILYSSFDELTISIIQTKKGYGPHINYTALFNRNYSNSILFEDTKPLNSFSLIIRRLIKFNDKDDTGHLNKDDNSIESYWLNGLKTNITRQDNNTNQPSFQLPLDTINGLLTIDINYPGESMRDVKFPKLCSTPKSYFLNIALKANNYTLPNTRFALEFYIIQLGIEGTQFSSSRYIDDHYTPGIFNVWQIKSLNPIYSTSILWKPVVYQSIDRSVEKTTLMEIYDLKNNISLEKSIDQGIFNSFYVQPYVSAFNISLGRAKDGFFAKSNYTFIQFTAGLDILEADSIKQFVTIAFIVSLLLPGLIAFIAVIFIIKRQCSKRNISSYDIIQD
ncbi:unnamed protein product [Rotaria sordida]|uniref:Uncharacterized protein n=1 Tax=Rotaria sordida TaxID=392033 RepID=A0A819BCC2_9BILA|nr:unnamed protein product [Rotaria sordida]CAF3799699.1 unnamed protein product [Rotaria sordida]